MAWQFFDRNDDIGTTEFYDYDADTDTAKIYTVEDVEPLLDMTRAMANEGVTDTGIKKGMWLYATLPTTVLLEMRKKGIDIYKKEDQPRVLAEINANYPYLKTTRKTHR